MDLVEFLRARLDEDEARVTEGAQGVKTSYRGWHTIDCGTGLGYWASDACECRFVDRVLAEVEAKRSLLTLADSLNEADEDFWMEHHGEVLGQLSGDVMLRFLALPYKDHPDYDESWRPVRVQVT